MFWLLQVFCSFTQIKSNQIIKNTVENLRLNERLHAHQLTQHNCQRLGCFPFPFGRRLFPFLTTRLMNLPKGKSTSCLLVGTPTRCITRRLGKGWFASIFLRPAQTIPLTLILFKQHFNQIVLCTKEGSTINVPTFEYQSIRPEGDFIPLLLPHNSFFPFTQKEAKVPYFNLNN